MGAEQSAYHQANNYIMDYIKHTYCTDTKCRTSPCVQHHSGKGPLGYICSDCFRMYREQHEEMKKEATEARERKERDWREHHAANVGGLEAFRSLGKGEKRVVLWDGDEELRKWKREEARKKKNGEKKNGEEVERKGEVDGAKNRDILKERFQGMFLPFYVGSEDDECRLWNGERRLRMDGMICDVGIAWRLTRLTCTGNASYAST